MTEFQGEQSWWFVDSPPLSCTFRRAGRARRQKLRSNRRESREVGSSGDVIAAWCTRRAEVARRLPLAMKASALGGRQGSARPPRSPTCDAAEAYTRWPRPTAASRQLSLSTSGGGRARSAVARCSPMHVSQPEDSISCPSESRSRGARSHEQLAGRPTLFGSLPAAETPESQPASQPTFPFFFFSFFFFQRQVHGSGVVGNDCIGNAAAKGERKAQTVGVAFTRPFRLPRQGHRIGATAVLPLHGMPF